MKFLQTRRGVRLYRVFLENVGSKAEIKLDSGLLIQGRVEAVNREFADLRENGRPQRVRYSTVKDAQFETTLKRRPGPGVRKKKIGRNTLYDSTVKTTLQLPDSVIQRLDEVIPELRKHIPRENRGYVTKGLILDLMTEIGLDDLKSRGKESLSVKLLARKLDRYMGR